MLPVDLVEVTIVLPPSKLVVLVMTVPRSTTNEATTSSTPSEVRRRGRRKPRARHNISKMTTRRATYRKGDRAWGGITRRRRDRQAHIISTTRPYWTVKWRRYKREKPENNMILRAMAKDRYSRSLLVNRSKLFRRPTRAPTREESIIRRLRQCVTTQLLTLENYKS